MALFKTSVLAVLVVAMACIVSTQAASEPCVQHCPTNMVASSINGICFCCLNGNLCMDVNTCTTVPGCSICSSDPKRCDACKDNYDKDNSGACQPVGGTAPIVTATSTTVPPTSAAPQTTTTTTTPTTTTATPTTTTTQAPVVPTTARPTTSTPQQTTQAPPVQTPFPTTSAPIPTAYPPTSPSGCLVANCRECIPGTEILCKSCDVGYAPTTNLQCGISQTRCAVEHCDTCTADSPNFCAQCSAGYRAMNNVCVLIVDAAAPAAASTMAMFTAFTAAVMAVVV